MEFKFNNFKGFLNELHIHNTIQSFASSLVGVFIPIFLYSLGFSLQNIFAYYLIYFLTFSLSSFLGSLLSKVGFKKVMFLRPISLILFYSWLYLLEYFPNTLFILAVYNGFVNSFYWIAFHYFFTNKVEVDNVDGKVGLMFSLPKIFTLFSPLIGGLIISFYSFEVLFLTVSLILIVSIIPLFSLKDYKFSFSFNLKNLFDKSFFKYLCGFLSDGVNYAVIYVLLPFFIYLTFNEAVGVGFFSTIFDVGTFLTPLIISYASRGKSSFFIKLGAVLEAFFVIFLFFANSRLEYFLLGFILGTFSTFWGVPFYSRMYKHAKKTNTLEFLIFREAILNIARVFVFTLMLLFNDFYLGFIIEAVSKLLFLAF